MSLPQGNCYIGNNHVERIVGVIVTVTVRCVLYPYEHRQYMNDFLMIVSERESSKRERRSGPAHAVPDDVEIFARFLGGDDEAFLVLFDRHMSRLGRYCRKMIGNEEHVPDLMQDLWEKVVRLRDDGRSAPREPLGLLYWMTRNICLNYVRARRRHDSLEDLAEYRHPHAAGHELTQLEELVIIALDKLPLSLREVLILNVYSGYTLEEIARMMGESSGAVRTRAWRARAQLKRIIVGLVELEGNRPEHDDSDRQGSMEDEE